MTGGGIQQYLEGPQDPLFDSAAAHIIPFPRTGISTLARTPEKASDYMRPLLSFAAAYVPKAKHKETPLYILCTAGMRLLPDW